MRERRHAPSWPFSADIAASSQARPARRFLTFRLGGVLYALPAESVFEVIPHPVAARIPQSPAALLGLANLRGAVLPVVSLRRLLGIDDAPAGASDGAEADAKADANDANGGANAGAKAIVVDTGTRVALAVENVESFVAIDEERIERPEADLRSEGGDMIAGAFRTGVDDDVARILDLDVLLGKAFVERAQRGRREARTGPASGEQPSAPTAQVERPVALVTFEVAGQEFALDLEGVEEIIPAPATLVAVPRAESLVLGVTSLRDRLLPLLSLRGLLGLPAREMDGREKVVVVNVGGARVGLVVDRAKALLAARPSAIDPMPDALAARTAGEARIKAIYRAENGRRLVSILSPEQLFREEVMRRFGQQNPLESSPGAAEASAIELRFLVFRLGDDEYALPIDAVDEVGEVPANLTRLPKTPRFLEGVVNLRGEVLPVVDQRKRFDMPALESERRRLIVVRTDRHRAGLIVDSVSEVLRVPQNAVEAPPYLTDSIARLVAGVINLEGAQRMVLVLEPAELLTPAERGRLDAFEKAHRKPQ